MLHGDDAPVAARSRAGRDGLGCPAPCWYTSGPSVLRILYDFLSYPIVCSTSCVKEYRYAKIERTEVSNNSTLGSIGNFLQDCCASTIANTAQMTTDTGAAMVPEIPGIFIVRRIQRCSSFINSSIEVNGANTPIYREVFVAANFDCIASA